MIAGLFSSNPDLQILFDTYDEDYTIWEAKEFFLKCFGYHDRP
jgi:hypothetical protein